MKRKAANSTGHNIVRRESYTLFEKIRHRKMLLFEKLFTILKMIPIEEP